MKKHLFCLWRWPVTALQPKLGAGAVIGINFA